MAQSQGARSVLATAVGWALVAVIGFFVLQFFIGTIFWLIRAILVVLVILGLLTLYLRLKLPKD